MSTNEEKAAQYVQQAEKKLQKGGFMSMLSGGNKQEEAAELYLKAANTYKMAKQCMPVEILPDCMPHRNSAVTCNSAPQASDLGSIQQGL